MRIRTVIFVALTLALALAGRALAPSKVTAAGSSTSGPTTTATTNGATIYTVTNPSTSTLNVEHVFTDTTGFYYSFWSALPPNSTSTYDVATMPQIPSPFTGVVQLYSSQALSAQVIGYDAGTPTPTPCPTCSPTPTRTPTASPSPTRTPTTTPTVGATSIPTPTPTSPAAATLFSDGFEESSFAAGGWTLTVAGIGSVGQLEGSVVAAGSQAAGFATTSQLLGQQASASAPFAWPSSNIVTAQTMWQANNVMAPIYPYIFGLQTTTGKVSPSFLLWQSLSGGINFAVQYVGRNGSIQGQALNVPYINGQWYNLQMVVDNRGSTPVYMFYVNSQVVYSAADPTSGAFTPPTRVVVGFFPYIPVLNSGTVFFDNVSVTNQGYSPSTPTATPVNTSTSTATVGTFSPTPSGTRTTTPTLFPTATNSTTGTPTSTPSNTRTATPTNSSTNTPTNTLTSVPSSTRTATPTLTSTAMPTATPTNTATNTPTSTRTATSTATTTRSATPTNAPTWTPSTTSTPTPTATPTNSSTATPTGLIGGLVSYYAFDDGSGTTVADSLGVNPGSWGGTLGSQWRTGIINGGGGFNGTDNYVDVGNVGAPSAMSVSVWLYAGVLSPQTDYEIVGKTTGEYDLRIQANQAENVQGTYAGTTVSDSGVDFAQAANENQWYHYVLTADPVAQRLALYRNGTLVGSSVLSAVVSSTTTHTWIGRDSQWNFATFQGRLDELGIWGRVLAPSEVAALYNNGSGLAYPFPPATPTATSTSTPTLTSTAMPTNTATSTPTNTPTTTRTATPTVTTTRSATLTNTPTWTPSTTSTMVATGTPTSTPTSLAAAIFRDGFEESSFAAGGWTVNVTGAGSVAQIETSTVYAGGQAASFTTTSQNAGQQAYASAPFAWPSSQVITAQTVWEAQTVGSALNGVILPYVFMVQTSTGVPIGGFTLWQNNFGTIDVLRNGQVQSTNTNVPYTTGQWYILQVVIDNRGANPIYSFYVNGQQVATVSDTTGAPFTPPSQVVVGFGPSSPWANFGTLIFDNVSVTNQSFNLTPSTSSSTDSLTSRATVMTPSPTPTLTGTSTSSSTATPAATNTPTATPTRTPTSTST